jgi:hypothetical protein
MRSECRARAALANALSLMPVEWATRGKRRSGQARPTENVLLGKEKGAGFLRPLNLLARKPVLTCPNPDRK